MSKTTLNIKIEESTKEEAQRLAKDMGMSLSAVVNGLITQFVRSKSLNLNATNPKPATNSYEQESSKKQQPEWFV